VTIAEQVGQRVSKRRDVLDITQEQLAEFSELSLTQIGRMERGKANVTIETLMRVCESLSVTPDYLLMGVDKGYRNDDLSELKDCLYRCSEEQIAFLKKFILWYCDQSNTKA